MDELLQVGIIFWIIWFIYFGMFFIGLFIYYMWYGVGFKNSLVDSFKESLELFNFEIFFKDENKK